MTFKYSSNTIPNMLGVEAGPRTEEEIHLEATEIVDHIRGVATAIAPIRENSTFDYNLGKKKILHYEDISLGDTLAELLTHEPDRYLVTMGMENPESPDVSKVHLEVARIVLGPNAGLLDLPPEALAHRALPEGVNLKQKEYEGRKRYFFSFPTVIPELRYTAAILSFSDHVRVEHSIVLNPK